MKKTSSALITTVGLEMQYFSLIPSSVMGA